MTDRELMQMALDALDKYGFMPLEDEIGWQHFKKTIEALRTRLAQPEPEPVAWADKYDIEREGHDFYANRQQPAKYGVSLYTAPPHREWQGLTDEEIIKLQHLIDWTAHWSTQKFAHAIEAKLKEKNG